MFFFVSLFTFHSYEIRNKKPKANLNYLLVLWQRAHFTSHFSGVGKFNVFIHFFASVGWLEARYI